MTYTQTHSHPAYGAEVPDHAVTPPDGCEDIGDEVCIRESYHWRPDRGETDADRRIVGYVIAHDVDGREVRCEGALMTTLGFGPRQVWTASGSLLRGDLTLSPSVQCHTHEFHGFVRRGQWVPA